MRSISKGYHGFEVRDDETGVVIANNIATLEEARAVADHPGFPPAEAVGPEVEPPSVMGDEGTPTEAFAAAGLADLEGDAPEAGPEQSPGDEEAG